MENSFQIRTPWGSGVYSLLGAGGLAREIAAYLHANTVFIDRDAEDREIYNTDTPLILAVGNTHARLNLAMKLKDVPDSRLPTINLGTCYSSLDRRGIFIAPGTIITVNVKIQPYTFINLNCSVGHDTVIGRCCVINPGANISGDVHIGDGVLIGTGATILEGLSIGDGATVGAGAVVTKNVEPGTTVVGVPARRMEK